MSSWDLDMGQRGAILGTQEGFMEQAMFEHGIKGRFVPRGAIAISKTHVKTTLWGEGDSLLEVITRVGPSGMVLMPLHKKSLWAIFAFITR